jgi:O-antigen/teichoic acid export membrane protein
MAKVSLKTLGRSTLVAGLAELWRILSRFILTPIIIAAIGMEGLGTWTLVFSVAAYVSMANASVGLAYVKLTAEYVHREEYDRLERVLGSGMTGIGSIALVGLLLVALFGRSILEALGAPAEQLTAGTWSLVLVMSALVLRMSLGCCNDVLAGLQRIDLTYRLQIFASIVEFAVTLPLLYLGHGLLGLGIGHVTGQILADIVAWRLVRRHLPQVRLNPFLVSREGLRQVFAVGGRFQALALVNTVVMHGVKFLISALFGVRWVGVYQLADRLVELGKAACSAVVAPMMPAFANLQAAGETERERQLFLQGSKAQAIAGGGSFLFLVIFALPVLLLWTGENVPEAAWTLRAIAIGEVMWILTAVVSSNLRAQGRVGLEFRAAMVSTVSIVLLAFPLARAMEYEGVIWARTIAQTLGAAWYLRAYFRFAGLSLREYLLETRIAALGLGMLALGGAIWAMYAFLPSLAPPSLPMRWSALVDVGLYAIPYTLGFGWLSWRIALTADEREVLGGVLKRAIAKRRGQAPPDTPSRE